MSLILIFYNFSQGQNHSLYFDGIDDFATIRPYDNLNFGRKDFTIELEALPLIKSGNNSAQTILSNKNTRDGFSIGLSINNTIYINMPNNIIYKSNNIGNIL